MQILRKHVFISKVFRRFSIFVMRIRNEVCGHRILRKRFKINTVANVARSLYENTTTAVNNVNQCCVNSNE
jgi:hypothetical protein